MGQVLFIGTANQSATPSDWGMYVGEFTEADRGNFEGFETVVIQHDLESRQPLVQVYDGDGNQLSADSQTGTVQCTVSVRDNRSVTLRFTDSADFPLQGTYKVTVFAKREPEGA